MRHTAMTDLTRCPCCQRDRVDEGPSTSHMYSDGLWIGCTACGFSVSGPDHAIIRAAWASCCRSTAIRAISLAPVGEG